MEAHILVCWANRIARAPIDEAWKVMAQIIVVYCQEERFADFDALDSKITFTEEDIRSIVTSNRRVPD